MIYLKMNQDTLNKKKMITTFLDKGILISSEMLGLINDEQEFQELYNLIDNEPNQGILVLNADIKHILDKKKKDVNWFELDKLRVLYEKGKNNQNYRDFVDYFLVEKNFNDDNKKNIKDTKVKVIVSHKEDSKKRDPSDFAQYFNNRYSIIEKILVNRQDLHNLTSINRVKAKKERESLSIIGLLSEKKETKNGNLMLQLEDRTGSIKVIVNQNKPSLYSLAKEFVLDDIISVTGVCGENVIFANEIKLPDIPNSVDIKHSPDEVYALFLSDIHVGSKNFLEDEFNRFLQWINCEIGNEKQKEIASKVKYIFVVGDLIDGCGVYPDQEKELTIKDIKEQYSVCASLLEKIPKDIPIIICPGNHDAIRVAEPQPPIYTDFAEPLYKLQNSIMVSNPAVVNIHSSPDFPGFNVLLYHGYSFDFLVAEVDSIRNNGGYDRADLIMKFLLQRRHLAPTHTATLYIPDINDDPLAISQVPDIFASGHIHKAITSNYRNVTMICSSCWQSITPFQEKMGHNPEPSRVPIVNLKTREVKILKFGK